MAKKDERAPYAETPDSRKLSALQAKRLADLSGLEAKELVGQTVATVLDKHRWIIDPPFALFRKICGKVVRKDPVTGVEYPVPFATVHVEDTDCSLVWYGPPGWKWGWFYPLFCHREEIATVKTDECGRFCVYIPWFDIDWILRWRKHRICFRDIFVRPSIFDLIPEELRPIPERGPFPPDPDPGPLRLPELPPSVLSRLTAGATRHIADRLAATRAPRAFGGPEPETSGLEVRAFTEELSPPLAREFRDVDLSAPEQGRGLQTIRNTLAGKLNVDSRVLERFDPRRFIGPFFRCFDVWLPEWSLILDVPDITFRVTQDVNNDGTEETIYGEGFFDVRWNAGAIPNTTLYASSNALVSHSCNTPVVPCGNQPAILYVGLMPLTNPPGPPPDPYHDAVEGYATRPNRPHPSGNINQPPPLPLAATPFCRTLQLFGCVELAGAAYYRIRYSIDNGGTFQPFVGLTWPLNRPSPPWQIWPVSDGDGWYEVVPAAQGWNPPNLLLEWPTSAAGKYILRLELGDGVKNVIATAPDVALQIDNTGPTVVFDQLSWKFASEPDSAFDQPGRSLLGICPTIHRGSTPADVEVLMKVSVSALHLRDASISASGCGGAAPALTADPSNHTEHWHMNPADNGEQFYARYLIDEATSPEGAYVFGCYAASRAFNPAGHDNGHVFDWNYEALEIYTNPAIAVAVVNS
jgi:hypothetical protein